MAYSKGMLPGAAARVAAFCSLVLTVGVARAERRPVAVVDLPGDPASEKLARDLAKELGDHPVLRNVLSFADELRGPLDDEDKDALDEARKDKQQAEEQLAPPNFKFQAAAAAATAGEDALSTATPTPAVLELYADLAFAHGRALLGDKKPKEAADAFALVHRLSPGRTLDPGTYLPELIKAFQDAGNLATQTAPVMVKGSGRVWIDGEERGPTGLYDVPLGRHVVWLTGPDRMTQGWRGDVLGKSEVATIADSPASDRVKIRRARRALRDAPDATARAAAIKQLAGLLGVHDAVLVMSSNGKLIVQTWRDKAPGFSALREVTTEPPRELLTTLAPPPPPRKRPPLIAGPTIEKTPRWYRRWSVRVGTGAGVALAVGSYFLISYLNGGLVPWDGNPGFRTGETQAR